MKAITFLAVVIITITSCNCKKNVVANNELKEAAVTDIVQDDIKMMNQELPLIEYSSYSRGYFKKITIENGRIYVQSAREAKPVFWQLNADDYKAIQNAYNEIDVTKLADLKAPTEKRFYDGAPITDLKITKGKEVFQTTEFDGGFPPSYIEKFVNLLLNTAEKLNK